MPIDLSRAIQQISKREVTSEQLVRDSIDAIRRLNPAINAFADTYFEESLETARDCDRDARKNRWRGPLHGIPFGVKDLFLTKNRRTTRGSVAFQNFVPHESAPIVERIEAAGAIMMGKTTTTELGWSGSSVSELFGPTRNPWDTELTSGGSSGGSAAAIASGMVPFALGSDGGGSVRIPAAFCGIFAMKGSLGRIPAYPWSATEMLSHAGPMTRTATDSTILFDLLRGPDPRDHLSLPDDTVDYVDGTIDGAALRVAYAPTLFDFDVDDEVAHAVREGISRIEQGLGITAEIVEPQWRDPIEIFETLWVAGRGTAYGRGVTDLETGFGKGFRDLVIGSRNYTLADYIDAMKKRAEFAAHIHGFFETYDLLLLPTVPILPFDAELEAPRGMAGASSLLPWTAWTPFTYPFNLSGNPAASIPVGLSSAGLPIGLQVVGRRHLDGVVLAFCRAMEESADIGVPHVGNADLKMVDGNR